jgi:hypothetical protein
VSAASSLAAAAVIDAPAGTIAATITGHPSTGLLFLRVGESAPAGPAVGATGPLDATAVIGAPAGTTVGTTT